VACSSKSSYFLTERLGISPSVTPSQHRTGWRTNSYGPIDFRVQEFVVVRFLVGTRVVCCSVVAVCRHRVSAVARSVSGGGVVAVRYSTGALAAGGVL